MHCGIVWNSNTIIQLHKDCKVKLLLRDSWNSLRLGTHGLHSPAKELPSIRMKWGKSLHIHRKLFQTEIKYWRKKHETLILFPDCWRHSAYPHTCYWDHSTIGPFLSLLFVFLAKVSAIDMDCSWGERCRGLRVRSCSPACLQICGVPPAVWTHGLTHFHWAAQEDLFIS